MEANHQIIKRTIPQSYMHITYNMRLQLINLVHLQKISIAQTCRKLGIKKSTAKSILREFRRKGKIFCRKTQMTESKQELQPQINSQNKQRQAPMPENQSVVPSFQINHSPAQHIFQGMSMTQHTYPPMFWFQIPCLFPTFYNSFL